MVPGNYAIGQVDAAATNGMSGGGVFNKYGEFLGVLIASSNFEEQLTANSSNKGISNKIRGRIV